MEVELRSREESLAEKEADLATKQDELAQKDLEIAETRKDLEDAAQDAEALAQAKIRDLAQRGAYVHAVGCSVHKAKPYGCEQCGAGPVFIEQMSGPYPELQKRDDLGHIQLIGGPH